MSKQLQQTVNLAQNLSPHEQIELLKAIFENLFNQPLVKFKLIDTLTQLLREAFYRFNQLSQDPFDAYFSQYEPAEVDVATISDEELVELVHEVRREKLGACSN
jgi:hypothetical protein